MNDTKKKTQLKGIQDWMQEALILSGQKTKLEEINQHVKASPTLNAAECLAIYQRSYYARLTQCLQDQYKALSYALGADLFVDFSKEYLKIYPSDSPTLSDLGARFPDFLRETRPDRDEDEKELWIDFMIDLAQFEWDLYILFDAKGHEGLPYANESTLDEDLTLQVCFFLRSYDFPVADFCRGVAQNNDPEIPDLQQSFVAISRRDYWIRTFAINEVQYFFLEQLLGKKNVATVLKITAEKFELKESALEAAWKQWRKEWIKGGFFV